MKKTFLLVTLFACAICQSCAAPQLSLQKIENSPSSSETDQGGSSSLHRPFKLRLELQPKLQKGTYLMGGVPSVVGRRVTATDSEGNVLKSQWSSYKASCLPGWHERYDKNTPEITLFWDEPAKGEWIQLDGSLKMDIATHVRQSAAHTCAYGQECTFTEDGVTFTVYGAEEKGVAEEMWRDGASFRTGIWSPEREEEIRVSRQKLPEKKCIWISVPDSQCNKVHDFTITDQRGQTLHSSLHCRGAEGARRLWFFDYPCASDTFSVSVHTYDKTESVEIPLTQTYGIGGGMKRPSGKTRPAGQRPAPYQAEVQSITVEPESEWGNRVDIALALTPAQKGVSYLQSQEEQTLQAEDACGRKIPCTVRLQELPTARLWLPRLPKGAWVRIHGPLHLKTASSSTASPTIPLTPCKRRIQVGGLDIEIEAGKTPHGMSREGQTGANITVKEKERGRIKSISILDAQGNVPEYAGICGFCRAGDSYSHICTYPEGKSLYLKIEVYQDFADVDLPFDEVFTLGGKVGDSDM